MTDDKANGLISAQIALEEKIRQLFNKLEVEKYKVRVLENEFRKTKEEDERLTEENTEVEQEIERVQTLTGSREEQCSNLQMVLEYLNQSEIKVSEGYRMRSQNREERKQKFEELLHLQQDKVEELIRYQQQKPEVQRLNEKKGRVIFLSEQLKCKESELHHRQAELFKMKCEYSRSTKKSTEAESDLSIQNTVIQVAELMQLINRVRKVSEEALKEQEVLEGVFMHMKMISSQSNFKAPNESNKTHVLKDITNKNRSVFSIQPNCSTPQNVQTPFSRPLQSAGYSNSSTFTFGNSSASGLMPRNVRAESSVFGQATQRSAKPSNSQGPPLFVPQLSTPPDQHFFSQESVTSGDEESSASLSQNMKINYRKESVKSNVQMRPRFGNELMEVGQVKENQGQSSFEVGQGQVSELSHPTQLTRYMQNSSDNKGLYCGRMSMDSSIKIPAKVLPSEQLLDMNAKDVRSAFGAHGHDEKASINSIINRNSEEIINKIKAMGLSLAVSAEQPKPQRGGNLKQNAEKFSGPLSSPFKQATPVLPVGRFSSQNDAKTSYASKAKPGFQTGSNVATNEAMESEASMQQTDIEIIHPKQTSGAKKYEFSSSSQKDERMKSFNAFPRQGNSAIQQPKDRLETATPSFLEQKARTETFLKTTENKQHTLLSSQAPNISDASRASQEKIGENVNAQVKEPQPENTSQPNKEMAEDTVFKSPLPLNQLASEKSPGELLFQKTYPSKDSGAVPQQEESEHLSGSSISTLPSFKSTDSPHLSPFDLDRHKEILNTILDPRSPSDYFKFSSRMMVSGEENNTNEEEIMPATPKDSTALKFGFFLESFQESDRQKDVQDYPKVASIGISKETKNQNQQQFTLGTMGTSQVPGFQDTSPGGNFAFSFGHSTEEPKTPRAPINIFGCGASPQGQNPEPSSFGMNFNFAMGNTSQHSPASESGTVFKLF